MHDIQKKLISVKSEIKEFLSKNQIKSPEPIVIAVCKTFSMDKILPLIDYGHVDFGENKVQEAYLKWSKIKKDNPNIKLHMVGKLQSNKVKKALEVFDYIHSVDNYKLVEKIFKYEKELGKKVKCFIQVNLSGEDQKSGIKPDQVNDFVKKCKENFSLNIIGLMCLPPMNENSEKYFDELNVLRENNKLAHLSMGMTNDYIIATKCGSTFLRIGSKIFGERKNS